MPLAAAFVLACCQSGPATVAEVIGADLDAQPSSTTAYRSITFQSPFDEQTTTAEVAMLEQRIDRLARLLGADVIEPTVLRFVPVDVATDEDDLLWFIRQASRHGMAGYATSTHITVVYVPRYAPPRRNSLMSSSDTTIHELVHVVANQVGLDNNSRWFAEGLAESIEHSFDDANGQPILEGPTSIITWPILAGAEAGVVDDLLRWPTILSDASVDRPNEHRRYVLARSFLNFLLRQREEPSYEARARAVMNLSDDELRNHEPAWLAFVHRHADPVAEARAYLDDRRPRLRGKALTQFVTLLTEHKTSWPVDIAEIKVRALAELDDAVVFTQAFNFLYFGARADLTDEEVDALTASPHLEKRLVGWALESVRNDGVRFRANKQTVRDEFEALSSDDARKLPMLTFLLESALAKP